MDSVSNDNEILFKSLPTVNLNSPSPTIDTFHFNPIANFHSRSFTLITNSHILERRMQIDPVKEHKWRAVIVLYPTKVLNNLRFQRVWIYHAHLLTVYSPCFFGVEVESLENAHSVGGNCYRCADLILEIASFENLKSSASSGTG